MKLNKLSKPWKFIGKLANNQKIGLSLVSAYYLFMAGVYALMSVVRHSQYQTYQDLAVFNHGIWQYSQFKLPFITYHINRLFLGDHFHPILVILAPLYWLYSGAEVLLVAQPFIMLSAIIPIYLIGNKLTRSKLFGFMVAFAYSFYLPLQRTIFHDFHAIIFVSPLFAWAYYFYLHKKWNWLNLSLILLLLVKEEVGFFVAAFGVYLALFDKKNRLYGLAVTIIGAAYSLLVIHTLIPLIGGDYKYFGYGALGNTPGEVLWNSITKPYQAVKLFFQPEIKIRTLKETFWPFGYLPLLSPLGLLLSLEQFFSRFLDLRTINRWRNDFHYAAPMTIVVALGTIQAVHYISSLFSKYKRVILIIFSILLLILTRIEQINRSAVLLIKRPVFWQRYSWMADIDGALEKIPDDAAVITQNNIVSHVSSRYQVLRFNDMDKADYILYDFHSDQTPLNYLGGGLDEKLWQGLEVKLKERADTGEFSLIYNQGRVYLYKVNR